MQASTTPDGSLNLRLESAEADKLRRSIKTAISAMVTLYAREGMTDAKNFFVALQETLLEP
jgi:hypothetical protein